MTNESPVIVPVSLSDPEKFSIPNKKGALGCQLKIHDSEVILYDGADKYILHAVLAEMSKNAR